MDHARTAYDDFDTIVCTTCKYALHDAPRFGALPSTREVHEARHHSPEIPALYVTPEAWTEIQFWEAFYSQSTVWLTTVELVADQLLPPSARRNPHRKGEHIMRNARTILTAATALTLAGGLGFAMTGQANADPVVRTAHAAIYEDEPGWDCTTQGNRVCGVAGTYGEIFLVTFDEQGQPVFVEHRDKTVWDYLPNNSWSPTVALVLVTSVAAADQSDSG
jgi:hypothetical protein